MTEKHSSPFAELEALRGSLPKGEAQDSTDQDEPEQRSFATKVVIHRERSGRGGKTVTVIQGVRMEGQEMVEFVRRMRKSLGTSGKVEGDRIVLGGDLSTRVAKWLKDAGARQVVIGN